MKILVTGGAGYVGSQLIISLLERQDIEKIVIYDNLSRGNYGIFLCTPFKNNERISFIQGDLLDSRSLKNALKDIDVVYHIAAKVTTPFADIDSHYFEQINHWGTAELVQAVEKSAVTHFIFVSSVSVYGSGGEVYQENSETRPVTFYGVTKLRGEDHVKRLQNKMKTIILRSANVYGFNRCMRFDAVINRFMFDANFTGRISIHGNGKQSRAFISVQLLAQLLTDVLYSDVPSGTYNVVDRNLILLDIVDVCKEIFPDLEFLFINQHMSMRNLEVNSDSILRKYIDYTNKTSLREELEVFKNKFSF